MRALFFLFLLCFTASCFAQDDDMPDYRSKKDNYTKVTQKDIKADLATFTMSGIDESIGKIPLRRIPVTNYGRDFMTFDSGGVQVTIRSAAFSAAKHRLDSVDKYLVKIDRKAYYG